MQFVKPRKWYARASSPTVKLSRRLKEKRFPDRYNGRHETGDKNASIQSVGWSAMFAR
jgi:hypothetical protein